MHILAEEVLQVKEWVDKANHAISGPTPNLATASELLAQTSRFLTEIVEEQPRPVRTSRAQ